MCDISFRFLSDLQKRVDSQLIQGLMLTPFAAFVPMRFTAFGYGWLFQLQRAKLAPNDWTQVHNHNEIWTFSTSISEDTPRHHSLMYIYGLAFAFSLDMIFVLVRPAGIVFGGDNTIADTEVQS